MWHLIVWELKKRRRKQRGILYYERVCSVCNRTESYSLYIKEHLMLKAQLFKLRILVRDSFELQAFVNDNYLTPNIDIIRRYDIKFCFICFLAFFFFYVTETFD